MNTIIYQVSGMTCGGCANRVKNTLAPLADTVDVSLNPPQAIITHPKVDLLALNNALKQAGHHYVLAHPVNQTSALDSTEKKPWLTTYRPLLLIITYIFMVCGVIGYASDTLSLDNLMIYFMAGFFLVFSFFKMLDLPNFASSYAMYDLLAKRVRLYGYLYPFIELFLGIAYLINGHHYWLNLFTAGLMLFSSLGVILAVKNKQNIRCACLGAVFNLPMSTVTVVEDLLMAMMAFWML